MTEASPPEEKSKPTLYVILVSKDGENWKELTGVAAGSAAEAKRKGFEHLRKSDGDAVLAEGVHFVAVPSRSWQPQEAVLAKVEKAAWSS